MFQYNLEHNLRELHKELNGSMYRHGPYRVFTVCDNKKRAISVAAVRDRVVHRLIYDCLIPIYDQTFAHDAWSCRGNKGLIAAIERAQKFLAADRRNFVWRADIRKFFDSVDHGVLLSILSRRVRDPKALRLIQKVVFSFREREREREKGCLLGTSPARFSPTFI